MNPSLGNSFNVANLFYNGGFQLRDGDELGIWETENLALDTVNSYSMVDLGMRVVLASKAASSIYQDFASFTAPFDFTHPIDGGRRPFLSAGYALQESRPLPRETPYTVAVDVTVESGLPGFRAYYIIDGNRTYSSEAYVQVGAGDTVRLHFTFDPVLAFIETVGIEFQSNASAIFKLDRAMLGAGDHSSLPYTGDLFSQVFPEGCIVMSLGEICPTGFKALGEDELQPLASWKEDEPDVKARQGNYPRSGTELAGDTSHTSDANSVSTNSNQFRDFEGFEGRLFQEFSNDPENGTDGPFAFTVNRQNPDVDALTNHTHEIGAAPTRPVSVGLTFCRRL